ncbi:MAG: DUF2062 domain-containing protein [Candidatus Dependentiae bacterium]|nr:DUF2062 domain-containing protein [Candidatus Dependentiae bacterium]
MATVKERFVNKIMEKKLSPRHVAWSGALGAYLAFSPFLGVQTILVFVLAFIMRANAAIAFTVLYTVNNPWTMIPIVVLDYVVGGAFLKLFGVSLCAYDPSWMGWLNDKLIPYIGPYLGVKKLCFWTYVIGGNLIAIPAACLAYPFIKKLYINSMSALERKQARAGRAIE